MSTSSAALSQPALIKMTRTEAYSRVRSAAAQEFANSRSSQIAQREEFERNYGSTIDLDQGFVNDMRALMLRASAIAMNAGAKKNAYDASVVPNKTLEKVASQLAGAVGECELYLATRKARSMFAPPSEADFLSLTYGSKVNDPYSWVGDRARHIVDEVLANVEIVDDVELVSVHALEKAASKHCAHDLEYGYPDDDGIGGEVEDDDTGGKWRRCKKRCGYGAIELTVHGEPVLVEQENIYALQINSISHEGVMRLPEGMTFEAYTKLPKKKREKLAAEIGEAIDGEIEASR